MRIIAGDKKGKRLFAPDGLETRPTSDKVKESLFNIIQFDIEGCRFLDLFAGSGQIGIEALSRGAERAVFVDAGRKQCECIKQNIENAGYTDKSRVYMSPVDSFLMQNDEFFDIIFMDPPYKKELIEPIFDSVSCHINENSIVICEIPLGEKIRESVGLLSLNKRYRYGKTELAVYKNADNQKDIY